LVFCLQDEEDKMAQAASMAEKAPRGVEESVDEKVQI
jgi:hypothetical protein